MNQMFNLFSQIMANPMGMLRKKYTNIPQNINDVEGAMKYLYENNQITQDQINQAKQMGNSPMWQMMMRMFKR